MSTEGNDRHLVLLVGANPLPGYLAVSTLRPARVTLVYSSGRGDEQHEDGQPRGTEAQCRRLRKVLIDYCHIAEDSIACLEVTDATSAPEVNEALDELDGEWDRLLLDYSGATKVMSSQARLHLGTDGGDRRAWYVDESAGKLRPDEGASKKVDGAIPRDRSGIALLAELHGIELQLPPRAEAVCDGSGVVSYPHGKALLELGARDGPYFASIVVGKGQVHRAHNLGCDAEKVMRAKAQGNTAGHREEVETLRDIVEAVIAGRDAVCCDDYDPAGAWLELFVAGLIEDGLRDRGEAFYVCSGLEIKRPYGAGGADADPQTPGDRAERPKREPLTGLADAFAKLALDVASSVRVGGGKTRDEEAARRLRSCLDQIERGDLHSEVLASSRSRGGLPLSGAPGTDIDVVVIYRHRLFAISCFSGGKREPNEWKYYDIGLRAEQLAGSLARASLVWGVSEKGTKNLEQLARAGWAPSNPVRVFHQAHLRAPKSLKRELTNWITAPAAAPDDNRARPTESPGEPPSGEHVTLPVGSNPVPCLYAARALGVSAATLLYTHETVGPAARIAEALKKDGLHVSAVRLASATSLQDSSDAPGIREPCAAMKDALLDYSGGTKVMAAQARLMLDGAPARASYITGTRLRRDSGDDTDLAPHGLAIEDYLVLHGYALKAGDSLPTLGDEFTNAVRGLLSSLESGEKSPKPDPESSGLAAAGLTEKDWLAAFVGWMIHARAPGSEVKLKLEASRSGVRDRTVGLKVAATVGSSFLAIGCLCLSSYKDAEIRNEAFRVRLLARRLAGDHARAAVVACATDVECKKARGAVAELWEAPNPPKVFGLEHLAGWASGNAEKLADLDAWLGVTPP